MVSIKMFGVRDEERPMAENWAKEHNVKIDMTSDILTLILSMKLRVLTV